MSYSNDGSDYNPLSFKERFPVGTRLRLGRFVAHMDCAGMPVSFGTRGTVENVESNKRVRVSWDNGQISILQDGVDDFRCLTSNELWEERMSFDDKLKNAAQRSCAAQEEGRNRVAEIANLSK